LLQHSEVINYIKARNVNDEAGKALFLMFDEKTEATYTIDTRGAAYMAAIWVKKYYTKRISTFFF